MDYESFYQELRQPDFISGYEILQKIGGGVFGEVFKARKKSIGRLYVIKFLKTESEAQRQIIEKELASLTNFAQIDHPNLVGIEDQGVVCDIPYIIMTFAGDQTLADRLARGPLAPESLDHVFHQILFGVEALHQRSIVHFDLKPANIFIKEDTIRVGDYGLSKLLSESRQSLSFGRGTPYYMAPEVMRRKGDLRSDVYSLGAILYELVTGKVPFEGDSDWEVLKKHEVEPLRFPDGFPPAYRGLVETAMSKNPEGRYPSAVAMRNAFLAATGHDGADTATQAQHAHAPGAPPEPAVTVSSPPPASNPTTLRINELARDASARFRAHVQGITGPGLGAVGSPGSGVSVAPPATLTPAPPPPPEPAPTTRWGGPPPATRAPRRRRRYGLLIFVLFITVVGFFTLAFFFLTATLPRSRTEVHRFPTAAPVPTSSRPGSRPPIRPEPSTGMVPAGLAGDEQKKPADEAEAAAKKRRLRQNLARLNRLVNEHGSVIKEFLDLMEDVNLAEVLQQLRGNDDSR